AALPALAGRGEGHGAADGAGSGRAPAGAAEELLAALWEELLGVERVAAGDDFFALGGHSLLAAQLVARIAQSFGVELPLRAVFDAPSLERLAAAVAAARLAGAGEELPPLCPVPRGGELPLSFAQERLWVLDRLAPGSPAYNVPALLALDGALDRGALAAAWRALVRRPEALRTTFELRGARTVQVVAAEGCRELPLVDLAGLPPAIAAPEASRWAAAEARRAFDLARGPLLRAALLCERPERHLLLLNLHHIVVDGWSLGILVRELAALYAAARGGAAAALPALPVQYADYAVWQRESLGGGRLAALLAYWRARLAPPLAPLDLPADRPRPAVQSFRGGRRQRLLAADLGPAVGRLGRRHGATAFMTLLAGFLALLHRHTGQPRIAVGSPVANRRRRELEGVVGLFLNTLVLDADLGDDPAFTALLGRVRESALAAYDHQEMPFERLVAELRPERDLARAPLVSVLFSLDQVPAPPPAMAGLTLEPLAVPSEAAKLDLALVLRDGGEGLLASLSYSADLFDAASIDRLAGHFERLLASALAAPERRVSQLELLEAGERHQLLVEWNATARAPEGRGVIQMFEAQAARTPGAPALALAGLEGEREDRERLSYADLNRRANRLARRLRACGVGPEVRVGIGLERSLAMVTAVLGVLKAGGAYVPLDPADPPARLRFLLADAGVAVL
ncbi:MAG TPA: condensation domain-containing protein, partial [Thermoanaerobaculia bacterium]